MGSVSLPLYYLNKLLQVMFHFREHHTCSRDIHVTNACPLHLHGNIWWMYGLHPSAQGLILAQQRIMKEVIVAESSQQSLSCIQPAVLMNTAINHKPEPMLHLSEGDHCLTPHPLLVLATCALHQSAVISECRRWESNWRICHLA